LHAELGVQVGQRLVHEECLRITHDRAAHGDPLALAAGEVGRFAVQVLAELEQFGRLLDPAVGLFLRHLGDLEGERHVLPHGHVRVQRVGLEDHRDVAILRRELVHDLAVHAQLAVADVLQAGDHVQRRGFAAAGRPDEDDELAVGDVQVQVADRFSPVRVPLGDMF